MKMDSYDPGPFRREYDRLEQMGYTTGEILETMEKTVPHLFRVDPRTPIGVKPQPAALATRSLPAVAPPPAPPSKLAAKAAWENAIESGVAKGMTRQAAASAVVREQPELQQRLLEAYNAPAPAPRAAVGYNCENFRRLNTAWKSCIAAHIAAGMTPSAASSAAASKNRVLREELVQAAAEHQTLVKAKRCVCPKPAYAPAI
jgi:hypothetical protein